MSVADELQKLEQLRQSGTINDAEFAAAKARIINGPPPSAPLFGNWNSAPTDPASQEEQTKLWALLLHLSLLAGSAVPLAGFIVPIVIWQLKKDDLPGIDEHGKNAVNWMISELIYLVGSVVLVLVVVGIPLFFLVTILGVVFPVIAAIKANKGEAWKYPGAITFF